MFHRTGSDVFYRGFLVAILCADAPATVRDEVETALDAFDAELTHTEKEYNKAYDDGYGDAEKAIRETMQEEIDVLQSQLNDARAEIESLKSLLRSATP